MKMYKSLPELIYLIGYLIKKNYKIKNQKRIPYNVISIGNITLGGTGKTPTTILLVEEAKRRGYLPVILTRGYKGKENRPILINTNGNKEINKLDVESLGDEVVLLAEKLKGAYIVKFKDRYEAGMYAIKYLKNSQIEDNKKIIFLLDDGFQHWGVYRDKDVVLIDSINPFGNKRLFPVGVLREPLTALRRADIVLITKSNMLDNTSKEKIVTEIQRYNENCPVFFSEHRPVSFVDKNGERFHLGLLEGKEVFAFCGIGNPESFKKMLCGLNLRLKNFKVYRDHYRYTLKDLEFIYKNAEELKVDWIVTTEKDIIKIKDIANFGNILALEIEIHVDNKDIFYDKVFSF